MASFLVLICVLLVFTEGNPPFGSDWFRSDASKVNLTYPNDIKYGEVFRWTLPKKPTVVMTYFPNPVNLTEKPFKISIMWKGSGQNKCDPYDWAGNKTCSCDQDIKEKCDPGKGTPKCARTSVNCIDGTGDFRIGLWDTISNHSEHQSKDDFVPGASGDDLHAYMNSHFSGYRGYHFRTMPHVSTVYHHPKSCEPGGFYVKQNSPDPFNDHRVEHGVFAGFGVPHDEWVTFSLSITRKSSDKYVLAIEMNGVSYNYTHTWDSKDTYDRPQFIDAFGIWFPNSRSYDYIEFASNPGEKN